MQLLSTGPTEGSASEMTYIVSSGALNSTHSLLLKASARGVRVISHSPTAKISHQQARSTCWRGTCATWRCLSAVPHVVSSVQRQPPISLHHQLVAHQVETVRLPWQVQERGTIYRRPSAQPSNRSLPLKMNLNRFFLDSHFVRGNVYIDCVQRSSSSAYTVHCAISVVLIALPYITLNS